MARMKGIEPREAGWLTRLVYWFVRRQMRKITGKGHLTEAIKIVAHHPRLLKAVGQMEMGQAAAHQLAANIKSLASLKAASLVGCPY